MNRLFFAGLGAALLLCHASAPATTKPASGCETQQAREFDFWIGDWSVTVDGKPAGRNVIERILDGCALLENWTGAQGGAGKSLNFFDAGDSRWHQTWIDRSGNALFLAGKFENGAMRMEGERPATRGQPGVRHRITWTPLPDRKVRQLWESSPLGEATWSIQFDGLYSPAQ